MFASLKNKIREETGSDISKLTAKITSSTAQKLDSLRGRSHHGSSSSINSVVSLDSVKEDGCTESRNDEELKRKILKIETEFVKKFDEKEREWREVVNERDKKIDNLESKLEEANRQITNLKSSVKRAEGINFHIYLVFNNTDTFFFVQISNKS